jgi:hypothetical protein
MLRKYAENQGKPEPGRRFIECFAAAADNGWRVFQVPDQACGIRRCRPAGFPGFVNSAGFSAS